MKKDLTEIKSQWIDEAIEWIVSMKHNIRGQIWSTDAVHCWAMKDAPSPNHYGALIARMKKLGLIEEAGYKRSTRPSANGRRILMWRLK